MQYFKNENGIIATNYKVMFTTLSKQENLTYLDKDLIGDNKVIVLCRNPYNRLESFFKNKLIKELENKQFTRLYKIFYPELRLNNHDSIDRKYQVFKALTFNRFITTLRNTHNKNRHLYTQTKFIDDISDYEFLKIEDKDELSKLESDFGLDFSEKHNNTDNITSKDLSWNREMYDIVNDVYNEDFETFNYSKK